MKTRWWISACVLALLTLACSAAVAQNGKNHDKGENHGQSKKQYRQFRENQRQYAVTYYGQNQNNQVFRHNSRWNNDYENRLRPGYVLDLDMRGMSRPAPYAMIRGFGGAPRGYRYIIIGGHVVLVDSGYRVHDTIRFELNIGR
jgi:opacity protein-like surface antigen